MVINKVTDKSFRKYGRVIGNYDLTEIIKVMNDKTPLPDDVVYEPSIADLESLSIFSDLEKREYGDLPIQIGYCNGHNHLLNAVEYHRSSEVNIAATDMILILGAQQDVENDYSYDTAKMEAFLIPQGTMVEVYATTLHYAPCSVNDNGFKCVVVLPKDTNLPLQGEKSAVGEDKLLFARNKWLIGHPDTDLGKDGAFIGLKGENLSIK